MTDDHDIMIAVRDGEIKLLGVLFQRHSKHLFNFFLSGVGDRDASEDLVQDVFLRMLKYRHTYRDNANFMVWMFAITRNVRTDYWRKRGGASEPVEYRDDFAGHNPESEEAIGDEDDARLVRKALARMPDDTRELLILSKYKNMRYRDIGTLLNCTEGAVKVRVYRALKELKEMYHTLRGAEA